MSRKNIQWLEGELPTLVAAGVLTAQDAQRLRTHYGEGGGGAGRNWALIVFGMMGSLLVGLGVILLFAHNWTEFTRVQRTLLSFAPLVLTQLLGGWLVFTGRDGVAWREGVGLGLALAVGSSIALIGQTYHIPGDAESFALVWTLLALPVVYLLRSAAVAALFPVGLVTWAGLAQSEGGQAVAFWPMLALLAPFVAHEARGGPYGIRPVMLLWAIGLCALAATGITLEKVLPGLWIVIYAGLLATLYLAGGYWGAEGPAAWQRPLHTIGSLGIVILSLMLTYDWPWEEIGWNHYRHGGAFHEWAAWWDYLVAAALPATAITLAVTSVRRGEARRILFGAFPVLAVAGYVSVVLLDGREDAALLLFNGYVFALGLQTLVLGFRERRLGTVNAGMLTLIALISLRFFDSELSIVGRGLVFIALGVVFLVTNLVMARRVRKGGAA